MPRPNHAPRNNNFSHLNHPYDIEENGEEYVIVGVYDHNLFEDADGDRVSKSKIVEILFLSK